MGFFSQFCSINAEIFFLEILIKQGSQGAKRDYLTNLWKDFCDDNNIPFHMSRSTFGRHIEALKDLGFKIECDEKDHYRLYNARHLRENHVLGNMINEVRLVSFYQKYRTLGALIQPQPATKGTSFLDTLGFAVDNRLKVEIDYHPFQKESYQCIVHPYCIKEDHQRWYLWGFKEHNEHNLKAQSFCLDRMKSVHLLEEKYTFPDNINPGRQFARSYGIWVDDSLPIETVRLRASSTISDYLMTLPLHQSQRDIKKCPDGSHIFTLNVTVTPNLANDLLQFGTGLEVLEPKYLRDEMERKTFAMACKYNPELKKFGKKKEK